MAPLTTSLDQGCTRGYGCDGEGSASDNRGTHVDHQPVGVQDWNELVNRGVQHCDRTTENDQRGANHPYA